MIRVLTLMFLLGAVGLAQASPEGIPTFPDQASHLEDYTVPGSETMQASFRLRSVYPDSAIISHYDSGLAEGWSACKAANHGWQSYVDTSGSSPKLVHQHIRYWVNFEQSKMMTVIVRHYSKALAVKCAPDNEIQHGVLVVSRSPKLDDEIALLKLTCDVDRSRLAAIPRVAACTGN